jgi:nitrile hydratase accessory protein|tara:strand:- start:738 stop:1091 length:354 start_codon:yes stop_codon:yes gene_type:complete
MYTHFEEYAVSSLNGGSGNIPKVNGKLNFDSEWTKKAFAIAIELSKQGYFEMEEFRQMMIKSISEWEQSHQLTDDSWSYYSIWTTVLESLIYKKNILDKSEVNHILSTTFNCKSINL